MHLPFLENQSEPPYKTTNKMKRTIIILLAALTLGLKPSAQDWSLSTNLIDYVSLGTLNAEGSAATGRHMSVNASVRYNPWTFQKGDPAKQMQNKNRTYAAGVRHWPWHIWSTRTSTSTSDLPSGEDRRPTSPMPARPAAGSRAREANGSSCRTNSAWHCSTFSRQIDRHDTDH